MRQGALAVRPKITSAASRPGCLAVARPVVERGVSLQHEPDDLAAELNPTHVRSVAGLTLGLQAVLARSDDSEHSAFDSKAVSAETPRGPLRSERGALVGHFAVFPKGCRRFLLPIARSVWCPATAG